MNQEGAVGALTLATLLKKTQSVWAPPFISKLDTFETLSLERQTSSSPRKRDMFISRKRRCSRKRQRFTVEESFLGFCDIKRKRQTF